MPKGVYKRKPFTEEHKRKIGLNGFHYGMLGKKMSLETKRKIGQANKGKKQTLEQIRKNREFHLGLKLSEEHKRKISESGKGKHFNNGMKGKHHSEETKEKISKKLKGKKTPWCTGENSNFWKGGISFEPYSTDWTMTLKRSIRERDKYICQICGKLQGDIAFSVHHIDYDKKNCNPSNLVSLCRECHSKTNVNRNYWVNYFYGFQK